MPHRGSLPEPWPLPCGPRAAQVVPPAAAAHDPARHQLERPDFLANQGIPERRRLATGEPKTKGHPAATRRWRYCGLPGYRRAHRIAFA